MGIPDVWVLLVWVISKIKHCCVFFDPRRNLPENLVNIGYSAELVPSPVAHHHVYPRISDSISKR